MIREKIKLCRVRVTGGCRWRSERVRVTVDVDVTFKEGKHEGYVLRVDVDGDRRGCVLR